MAVFLSRRWNKQPQGPVGIDWGNRLSEGLLVAVLPSPSNMLVNLVDGSRPTITSSNYTFGYRAGGSAFIQNSTDSTVSFALRKSIPLGTGARYTLGSVSAWNEGPNNVMRGYPGPDIRFQTDWLDLVMLDHWNGASDNRVTLATPGAATGAAITVGYDGTNVWAANRVNTATAAAGGLGKTITSVEITLDWDTQGINTYSQLLAFWESSLYSAAALEFAANPWQLFRPIQQRIYVNVAAVGGLSIPIAAYHYNHHLGSMSS